LEQYFEVNDIAEDKKVPALLTLLGGKTYTLLRNLTAPNKPKEKDYTTLVNLLRDHLTPKPIVIAERFRFHKRNQLQCESVNAHIAELRKLTEFCEFGLNLNVTLRDRFVCGVRNDQIQKELFPDFFFCGHPTLYERECHLEHSAILWHLSSRSPLQLQFLMLYLAKVL
jgi:hypothetical protein